MHKPVYNYLQSNTTVLKMKGPIKNLTVTYVYESTRRNTTTLGAEAQENVSLLGS